MNTDIYLCSLPFPSSTLPPKLLSAFLLSPLEIPPTPLFLLEPGSDFIALPLSLFLFLCFSFSSHYPIRCRALEPSPPHWASLGDAEGLSLRLLSLPACVSLAHKQWRLPVSTSLSLFLLPPPPPKHCAALPPILALSSSHSLSLL